MIGQPPRQEPLPEAPRPDTRGVMLCPWKCGQLVRRTINGRARYVYVDLRPDPRGRIAAYWDGGVWRSHQLHKGEGPAPHERRFMIHKATCWRLARANGRVAKPPRPVVVPPPPGPIPAELAEQTRAELDEIRARRRSAGRAGPGRDGDRR